MAGEREREKEKIKDPMVKTVGSSNFSIFISFSDQIINPNTALEDSELSHCQLLKMQLVQSFSFLFLLTDREKSLGELHS